jgi:hypothetical protein
MLTVTQIINVTAQHIADGVMCAECECPIALAILDQIQSIDYVGVGGKTVELDGLPTVELPPEAIQFVADFDNGRHVEPFAFPLDVPVSP